MTLVIAALAPFLVLIALVALQHQTNERDEAERTAKELAVEMAQKMDSRISMMEVAILALKHSLSSAPERAPENDRVLRALISDLPPNFAHFTVIGPQGKIIGTSDTLPNGERLAIEAYGDRRAQTIRDFRLAGPLRIYGDQGPHALALSYKIDSTGSQIIGFIPTTGLQRLVVIEGLPEGSVAALVNDSGLVVASSRNASHWVSRKLRPGGFSPPDSDVGVGLLHDADGAVLYAAYAKMQFAPFRVYVGMPELIALATARRDFWRAIGWGLLASILGVGLAWTQAARIVRPLEQLSTDAAILGRGELGHRSRVQSTDELGRLAASINAMAETLELREAEAIQAQKMESVGQLAGGIAHDFNNLLTVISGRLELLAGSSVLTADELEDIGEIRTATTRAISLTGQLLAFSRKQLLRPKVISLNAVLDELEPMLRRLIGEDVQIIVRRDPLLGTIVADPGQVHQVLLNLSLNARDAMPSGGLLRIETSNEKIGGEKTRLSPELPPGEYVVVSVADSGHGMDERTKARIFDPFFTTKAAGKGTGLGLSTVYGIVKQSGAAITVDSAPGSGTTFRVYFPRARGLPSGEYPALVQGALTGTESVLIVEDERSVRDLATKILEARGYKVIAAAHGGDALQIVAGSERRIDLVLTDVVMPGMSGRELVEALRKSRPTIKVLYMSGYTDDEIVRRGLLDPAVDFIQKPFTADKLALQTRRALDG